MAAHLPVRASRSWERRAQLAMTQWSWSWGSGGAPAACWAWLWREV